MKPFQITYINGIILVILGLSGYFLSQSPSVTALIPVFAGAVLLALSPLMKKGNRVVAHIVVVLTFLLFVAFYMPLSGAISRNDLWATVRVIVMMLSTLVAVVVYIKSFIDARRKA